MGRFNQCFLNDDDNGNWTIETPEHSYGFTCWQNQWIMTDENGNTVVFSETNLTGETAGDGLWLFLDEGLRCGGMHRRIAASEAAVRETLCGVGKEQLWEKIAADWAKEA